MTERFPETENMIKATTNSLNKPFLNITANDVVVDEKVVKTVGKTGEEKFGTRRT